MWSCLVVLFGFAAASRREISLEACDWQCYVDRYPDLKQAFGNNLIAAQQHYHNHGRAEGRKCTCPEACDWQCYVDRYPDLKQAFGNNLTAAQQHYHNHGRAEGRKCTCPEAQRKDAPLSVEWALLEDAFPPVSAKCLAGKPETRTTMKFAEASSSSSTWSDMAKNFESEVFMAEMEHRHPNPNLTWTARFGQGGNVYSYRGIYGEAMPPQHNPGAPWIDEVWQQVAVNRKKGVWFMHQAGPYQKTADLEAKPWYSPNLAKHCGGNACMFAAWGQASMQPNAAQRSGMLFYARYHDCGEGVMETTWLMHNTAKPDAAVSDRVDYISIPWAGVRPSTLRSVLISQPAGNAKLQVPLKQFGDNKFTLLKETGGYTTFAQDLEPKAAVTVPTKLVLKQIGKSGKACRDMAHRGLVQCLVEKTKEVKTGSNIAGGLEFVGGTKSALGKVRVKSVLHWAWVGQWLWFAPSHPSNPEEINQHFRIGDEIKLASGSLAKEDNQGLSFVHARDSVYAEQARIRYGYAGGSVVSKRDYTVWTVNMNNIDLSPGNTYWNRQFVITGPYMQSDAKSKAWVAQTGEELSQPSAGSGRSVTLWRQSGTSPVRATVADASCDSTKVCIGSTSPVSGLPALFSVSCGGRAYIGHDPYSAGVVVDASAPWRCTVGGRGATWKLLGYFEQDACSTVSDAAFAPGPCA